MLTAMEGSDNATALTTDFKIIAQRMKLLGFNAIRLPFSFQVVVSITLVLLDEVQPAHVEHLSCSPLNGYIVAGISLTGKWIWRKHSSYQLEQRDIHSSTHTLIYSL